MRSLLAVSVLLGLVACDGLEPLLNLCANPPKTPPKTLSDKMGLPDSYKISGSLTDWMTATSSLITESSTKEFRVLERKSRDAQTEKWIQSLTGEKLTMFVNASSGECDAKANKTNLIPDARFASILGSDTSSYYAIIQGLLRYLKDRNGFIIENDVEIIGGVNSAKWVSCIDGANATDNKVLLEVRYAGDNTIPPSQPAFSNPLLLSVRLAELPSFNSTVALKHVSVEIDRYELPTGNEAAIVHGVYCQNRNSTTLPLKSLDEYAAVLNYFDHGTNRSEVIEVLYSKSRQILVVAGDSFENGVKLLKSKHDRFRNGTDYILHDFKYGYEFTMSRGACESFSTLIAGTNDVILEGDPVENSTLSMNKMEFLLVDPSLRWDDYGDDVDMTGKPYKTYRAYDSRDETISELHLTEDGEVHSLATFRFGSRHLAVTMTVSKIPTESSRLNLKATQLSDCYDDGKYANNTWIVQIKDKNFLDMGKVGLNNLNNAVAESISKNVYPVIPYRIVVFYVENKDSGISVILRIVEKSEKQPAKVVGYNYTAELPTFDLFNLMNATMFLEKMPIEVEKVGGIKEEWVADANTMKMYPPDNDTGFLGYTGGAMFVLAIFCLLIGVSIGAVGVFVATRRQRISTLAYQVFE